MLLVLIKLICDSYLYVADNAMVLSQVHVVRLELFNRLLFQLSTYRRLQLWLTSVPQNVVEALSESAMG